MVHDINSMDKPLDRGRQRKRTVVLVLRIALLLGLLVLGAQVVAGWFAPSVERRELLLATVEYGAVESVITASGTVVPEREVVLPSAADARVLRVLHRSGDSVTPGQPLVLLDITEARAQLARLVDRIALKRNEQLQARAAVEARLVKLKSAIAIKQREAEYNELRDQQNRAAWEKEFIAANEVRESAMVLARSRDELEELRHDQETTRKTGALQQDGLSLELSLLHKEKEELERQIALSTPAADRAGVITWITQTEGVMVRRGDVLARIADLSSYRVQGTVSDAHAAQLAVGMPARVQTGSTVLHGVIVAIQPAVENGAVVFVVGLSPRDAAQLRPNLRVEVSIVTDTRSRALRLKRGALSWRNGRQELFVVRSRSAVRTPVEIGMTGTEYYEIRRGVQPGDTVIVSPMDDFREYTSVDIE